MPYKDKNTKKWVGSIYYTDITGDTKRKRKKGFSTKKEALEWELLYKNNMFVKQDDVNVNFMSFKELCDSYIYSLSGNTKPTTIERYKTSIKSFKPLYNKKANQITVKDIMSWQQHMRLNDEKSYSINTINNAKTTLGAIFDYGMDTYGLQSNPAKRVKRLKNFKADQSINYIDIDTYLKLEKSINDILYKTFFMFLFYTGARRGEAQALTWKDINFKTKNIIINKTLNNKTKGMNYVISVPKTANSKRKFKIPDKLLEQLKVLKSSYRDTEGFSESWFIFGGINPLKDTTIERRKNKYFKEAKIKPITIHEFRHSHATLLINNGVRIDVVQKRLGHASIQTTIDFYGAMYEQASDEATDLINNL
ncbi:tyrosine-type recombinase/integrase [Erysipelotrichaceae bacterium OttesenSCG-928-M19]|nr:tyrosine-type recombinase/integrase [Erysipelotrichaceae bacterium OttesenSCG-928-M19]